MYLAPKQAVQVFRYGSLANINLSAFHHSKSERVNLRHRNNDERKASRLNGSGIRSLDFD